MSLHDIPTAMGALFIGAFFATMLSGVVLLQSLLYFTTYRSDRIAVKLLVLGVWGLGPSHASIWDAMWDYLIVDCGDTSSVDHIPWSVPLTFIPRAIVTFFVHNFFAHPIYLLSNKNWLMASPVVILAIVRLVSASVSTWEMLHYHSYELFKMRMPMYTTLPRWSVCHLTLHFQWIFTPGLFVSSLVDIVITGLLLYLFQSSRLDSGQ